MQIVLRQMIRTVITVIRTADEHLFGHPSRRGLTWIRRQRDASSVSRWRFRARSAHEQFRQVRKKFAFQGRQKVPGFPDTAPT